MSVNLCRLKMWLLFRRRRKTRTQYSDYDVPDDDPEISSVFSKEPLTSVYDVPYTCDPYAAFDPDVSATTEGDNHELAESGVAQRSFKKIGEQWGAMVTSQSTDRGKSHVDSRGQYSEEKSARRDASYRRERHKSRSGWRRSAGTWSPSGRSPELSVQDEAVGTTPRIVRLVSEEVQTVTEEMRLTSPAVEDNCLVSCDGVIHGTASTQLVDRDKVDQEVQCSLKTADLLKKEYTRLELFCDLIYWFNCFVVDVQYFCSL